MEEDLILKFEIAPGKSPAAESVAQAIAAFVDVLRAAAAVVEPQAELSVELVGVEHGSQMFKLALRKAYSLLEEASARGDEFPLAKKFAITLGGLIGSTVVIAGITNAITPDPRIPADQMAVVESLEKHMAESVELQRQAARFWGINQDEPAFDRIDVLNGYNRAPIYQVPRGEFAARSGLWSDESAEIVELVERRTATWDVVLVKPTLVPEQRRWTFARDGLEFSALMTDKAVLQAIHDRTLPLSLQEGIAMKIEIQYRERYDGKVWLPVSGSHRVKRVISPRPTGPDLPLFPSTRDPDK